MEECSQLSCQTHSSEIYKFFCKDCKSCVCLVCLEESHDDHTFCKLISAKDDIKTEICAFFSGKTDTSEECATKAELLNILNEHENRLELDKFEIKQEIETAVSQAIDKLQDSKDQLIKRLDEIYSDILEPKRSLVSQIENADKCVSTDSESVDEIVKQFVNLRHISARCYEEVSKTQKPLFVRNQEQSEIGHFCLDDQDDQKSYTSVVEFEDSPYFYAKSSLNKIQAVSTQEIWMLEGTKLAKTNANKIEEEIITDKVIDFIVMKDGSVIVCNTNKKTIEKVLSIGKKVLFADLGDFVLLAMYRLGDTIALNVYNSQCYQVVFNKDGMLISNIPMPTLKQIATSQCSYPIQKCEILDSNEEKRSVVLTVSRLPDCVYKLSLVKDPTTQYVVTGKFQGVYGLNPGGFRCRGFCVDNNNNVIISDAGYNCVYVLDKDLKYVYTIIKSEEFLINNPGNVVAFDDIVWIADGREVYKFKRDQEKLVLQQVRIPFSFIHM